MTIVRTHCNHGHNLSEPGALYVDYKGHRRCRTCHLARMKRYKKRVRPKRPKPPSPAQYQGWAAAVWRDLTERERALVAMGLESIRRELA